MGDELNLKFKTVSYRGSTAIFSVTSFWDKYARDTDCLHYIQKTHVQVIRKKMDGTNNLAVTDITQTKSPLSPKKPERATAMPIAMRTGNAINTIWRGVDLRAALTHASVGETANKTTLIPGTSEKK